MDPLISLENHRELKRICEKYERELDQILNEVEIGAMIGSPIKYTKIKNNSKKYQKALVQQALNDVDYEKKKEKGADNLDAKQKSTLAAANKAKNKALADKASAISQRMSDLASSDGLKTVEKLAKSKAKIAAAETALKAADAEESKQLKLKIRDWSADANDAASQLKDHAKEGGDDEGGDKDKDKDKGKDEAKQEKIDSQKDANKDLGDVWKDKTAAWKKIKDDKPDSKDKEKGEEWTKTERAARKSRIESEIAMQQGQLKLAQLEGDKERVKELGKDISDSTAYLKDPKQWGGEKKKEDPKKEDMGEKEKERLEKAEKILKGAQESGDKEKIAKAEKTIKSLKDTVLKKEGEDPMEDLRNEINEKAVSLINESVKDKFARLLNEKRSV